MSSHGLDSRAIVPVGRVARVLAFSAFVFASGVGVGGAGAQTSEGQIHLSVESSQLLQSEPLRHGAELISELRFDDGRVSTSLFDLSTPSQDASEQGSWTWQVRGGIRFFSAIGSSAAIEVVSARDNGRGNTRGWVASAELGSDGTGAFLGYRRGGTLWNAVALGASYVQLDEESLSVESQSFLGPEFRLTLLGVGFSTAYRWRVSGSAPGDAHFFDASMLIGWW